MNNGLTVAVVGATGLVGRAILALLEERNFPLKELLPMASSRSVGRTVAFRGASLPVRDVAECSFEGIDCALFSAGAALAEVQVPRAAQQGCIVIDNSSCFRREEDVPLVVPEVNPEALEGFRKRNIIANPNCSTIQLVMVLKPIFDAVGITRVNVATYQAVSGAGATALEELRSQSSAVLKGRKAPAGEVYPRPIAFNVLPHIDVFQENGYTREEMKIVWETRRILDSPELAVNPSCARVAVFHAHSEAVHLETRRKISSEQARRLLASRPGVRVLDEHHAEGYPTAALEGAGQDAVFVGRIREDISHPRGLNLWIVADNLRKGAALNSVQIAEMLHRVWLRPECAS